MSIFRFLSITMGIALTCSYAYASPTSNLNVSANVWGVCSLSTNDLGFGLYDQLSPSNLDRNTNITVNCTKQTCYKVNLGSGNNYSGQTRNMKHQTLSALLSYNLYKNASHTSSWGRSNSYNAIASGNDDSIKIYGSIPAKQSIPAGSYRDTIAVTVSYNISDCKGDNGGDGEDGEDGDKNNNGDGEGGDKNNNGGDGEGGDKDNGGGDGKKD